MIRIEFDDSLMTGDPTVDEQHRTLIGLFNDLYDASVDGRGHDFVHHAIEQLAAYTREHFSAEQALMQSSRFPADEMLEHSRQHAQLEARVSELVKQHASGGMVTILPLATLLGEWLADHIRKTDKRLVEHLKMAGADA